MDPRILAVKGGIEIEMRIFMFLMAIAWFVMALIYEEHHLLYLIMSQIWCAAGAIKT
jgi:hypothetical protein